MLCSIYVDIMKIEEIVFDIMLGVVDFFADFVQLVCLSCIFTATYYPYDP